MPAPRTFAALARMLCIMGLAVVGLATPPLHGGPVWAQSALGPSKPATLAVWAPVGASIYVDGTFVGTAPLVEPIKVPAGRRVVTVTLNGFHPETRSVSAEAGKLTNLSVDLTITDQRITSWVLLGTGIAGIVAGIVFGTMSVVEHRNARDILQRQDELSLNATERQDYQAALDARDDYRVVSGVVAGVGLGALVLGGTLYVLDDPQTPKSRGDGAVGQARKPNSTRFRLSVEPSFVGGGVTVHF